MPFRLPDGARDHIFVARSLITQYTRETYEPAWPVRHSHNRFKGSSCSTEDAIIIHLARNWRDLKEV